MTLPIKFPPTRYQVNKRSGYFDVVRMCEKEGIKTIVSFENRADADLCVIALYEEANRNTAMFLETLSSVLASWKVSAGTTISKS